MDETNSRLRLVISEQSRHRQRGRILPLSLGTRTVYVPASNPHLPQHIDQPVHDGGQVGMRRFEFQQPVAERFGVGRGSWFSLRWSGEMISSAADSSWSRVASSIVSMDAARRQVGQRNAEVIQAVGHRGRTEMQSVLGRGWTV